MPGPVEIVLVTSDQGAAEEAARELSGTPGETCRVRRRITGSAAISSAARSTSSCVGSKVSTSWAISLISPASLWSTRPRTSTMRSTSTFSALAE